ncbi:MAG: cytochrome c3 family protein [Thermodesulfobacteriota bacterium]|nr:cytochrome c3 family protein [Thermodesulfobacteriota bacterium]
MKKFLFLFLFLGFLIFSGIALGRIGGGDIKYAVKRVGEVTFSHDTHIEAMGFNCTECHPITFVTKEQHKPAKMIHRRQSQSCGKCHDGKQAFDLRGNCYICHNREVK